MKSKHFLSLALLAIAWMIGITANAQSLTLDATEYTAGATITVTVNGANQLGAKDWVGIYEADKNPGSANPSKEWAYVNGQSTLTFTITGAGSYYVTLLANDGYEEIASRVNFTVVPAPDAWMSRLNDNTPVWKVSIPGSHDAATGHGFTGLGAIVGSSNAQTQDKTLTEQWESGIRCFDLRPAVNGSSLEIYHGSIQTKLSMQTALETLCGLLDAHPTEFCIVVMRHESDADSNSSSWASMMSSLLAQSTISSHLATFNAACKVSELRGKLLIISRDTYDNGPKGVYATGWNHDGVCTSAKLGSAPLYMQDFYETSDIEKKKSVTLNLYKLMLGMRNSTTATWCINYCSGYNNGSIASSNGYRDNAAKVHAALLDCMSHYIYSNPMGIVMMDYAGVDRSGSYNVRSQELTNAIIESNFPNVAAPALVDGVYQIGTASELEWFSEYVAVGGDNVKANAVLTADLDFTGITHRPIGISQGIKYQGKFDGKGHHIKNMVLDLDQDGVGVFGYARGNCSIKNLIVDASCSFKGKHYVGGIIGAMQQNDGFMDVFNCVNYADVEATIEYAGGIAGGADAGWTGTRFRMHSCVNFGNVKAPKGAATFVGYNKAGGGNAQIWHCYNAGSVESVDGVNNAFRGANRSVAAYYDLVYTASNMQGEHITWTTEDPAASGELCWYLNNYKASEFPSEGVAFKQTIGVDPYPLPVEEGDLVYQNATYKCDGTAIGGVAYSNTNSSTIPPHTRGDSYTCTVCGNIIEDYVKPDDDGFYHLSTVTDVEWFSAMVNEKYHGCMNAKLDNDIDFGGVPNAHKPIGISAHKWAGIFDGQGHRIKGMVITRDFVQSNAYDGLGFFGSVRGGIEDAAWGQKTMGATIKNLIIDKSCSIEHGSQFAAGVVGHVNSRFDNTCVVSIINCGNEANITIDGKQAAGILGCVEGTQVGIVIRNCWNKGNISGSSESATICGWTGTSNAELTKEFSGCWNSGKLVRGLDGNGYNMFRTNDHAAIKNIVDLNAPAGGKQGKVTINTEDPIASGELCYLLNGDQSTIAWTQTIGVEAEPNPAGNTSRVYEIGTLKCNGEATGELTYSNTEGSSSVLPHETGANGFCSICGENMVSSLTEEDGYYLISNAGELEFFSGIINKAGGAAINGKLTANIDMAGVTHTPIGYNTGNKFQGTFDGQGHRILNLTEFSQDDHVGLIGWLRGGATVRNVIIDKTCSFTGQNHVAGIAAGSQVTAGPITIENCINEGSIHVNDNHAGGIYGKSADGGIIVNIINCGNSGTITGDKNVVAIGSWMGNGDNCHVTNCWNTGLIVKSEWERGFRESWQEEGHTVSELNLMNGGNINKVSIENTYDASASEIRTQGTLLSTEAATSGELCYRLNKPQGDTVWYQTLGEDEHPVLDSTHDTVEGDEPTISAAGYATYVAPFNIGTLPDGMEAFAAQDKGSYIHLEPVTAVPAESVVVLKGAAGQYLVLGTKAAVTMDVQNDLKASANPITANGQQYILAKPSGNEVGFYQATTGTTIAAGKGYLESQSGAKALFFVESSGDNETAIAGVKADAEDAVIYNLAGQRISKAVKGVNIIDGKKVVMK